MVISTAAAVIFSGGTAVLVGTFLTVMRLEESRGWPKPIFWPGIFLVVTIGLGFCGHMLLKSHDFQAMNLANSKSNSRDLSDELREWPDKLRDWADQHGLIAWARHHGIGPAGLPSNDPDALYIETLQGHIWGIGGSDSDREALIREGHEICNALQSGLSREVVHDRLVVKRSKTSDSDASWMITASVASYCPTGPGPVKPSVNQESAGPPVATPRQTVDPNFLYVTLVRGNVPAIEKFSDADLVEQGHRICGRLQSGQARSSIRDELDQYGWSISGARWVIDGSVMFFCPGVWP